MKVTYGIKALASLYCLAANEGHTLIENYVSNEMGNWKIRMYRIFYFNRNMNEDKLDLVLIKYYIVIPIT